MNVKAIKKLMIDHDLRAKDIAQILGIKKDAAYARLSGLRPFKIEEVKALAEYFKVDINELIN